MGTEGIRRQALQLTGKALCVSLLLGSASGATWRSGDHLVIAPGEVIQDDLYVTGDRVQILGQVNGDLTVLAREAELGGAVSGTVTASAQKLEFAARTPRSARLLAASLEVQPGAWIGADLLASGLLLDLRPGARIGRDLAFAGVQSRLGGHVTRNVWMGGYALELAGTVGGDARVNLDNRATWPAEWIPAGVRLAPMTPGLSFKGAGRVQGDLRLQMPDRPAVPSAAVGGEVNYTPGDGARLTPAPLRPSWTWPDVLGGALLNVGAALLIGWAGGRRVGWAADHLRQQPGRSLGAGLLAVLGLPLAVAAGIALLALLGLGLNGLGLRAVGLPLSLLGSGMLVAVSALIAWAGMLLAQGLVSLVTGRWMLRTLQPGQAPTLLPAALLGGGALSLLTHLPWLGGVLSFAVLLLGVGALLLWWRTPGAQPTGMQLRPQV